MCVYVYANCIQYFYSLHCVCVCVRVSMCVCLGVEMGGCSENSKKEDTEEAKQAALWSIEQADAIVSRLSKQRGHILVSSDLGHVHHVHTRRSWWWIV